ncbi:hypothetical protein MLD38_007673 [Melastoma candidum]|uniref:Uncharacterized protein n=1 Tax=Melastoma candidum TaxID=119954 RepID=A0ACB9RRH2_9MYRT|nr:hypothetical protein MLD38_007673 [Melastoma candidum]
MFCFPESCETYDLVNSVSQDIVIRNLDYIFAISPQSIVSASPDVLLKLEKQLKSSESWSYRQLPTPTAAFPAIINSEEEDSDSDLLRTRVVLEESGLNNHKSRIDSSFLTKQDSNEHVSKQIRALHKKLQQIEMIKEKQPKGHRLDSQQIAKLQTRSVLESSLAELGVPIEELLEKPSASESTKGKGNILEQGNRKGRARSGHSRKRICLVIVMRRINRPLGGKCQEVEIDVGFFPLAKTEIAGREEKPFSDAKKESWNDEKVISRETGKGKSANAPEGRPFNVLESRTGQHAKRSCTSVATTQKRRPCMGGAKLPKGSTSLREILDEQKMNKDVSPIMVGRAKHGEVADVNKSEGRMNLSFIVPSGPIAVRPPPHSSHGLDAERGTPPWASSGTPPLVSRPSLTDIQQQQQGKQPQALSMSPKTRTSGFAIASGQVLPSDPAGMNHWFKQEAEATSSIRVIQIEEKAMKDLKRFYSTVKIVKNNNH